MVDFHGFHPEPGTTEPIIFPEPGTTEPIFFKLGWVPPGTPEPMGSWVPHMPTPDPDNKNFIADMQKVGDADNCGVTVDREDGKFHMKRIPKN